VNDSVTNLIFELSKDPQKIINYNLKYADELLSLTSNIYQRHFEKSDKENDIEPLYKADCKDRRFKSNMWNSNPFFDYISQVYLLNCNLVNQFLDDCDYSGNLTRRKINFFARYALDALSPSNFMLTSPEIIKAALESNGQTIVNGLNNFYKDLQKSKDNFSITTTAQNIFKIGENIASSKGEVIYKNELMELIHYYPVGKKVYETPILIIPAWINKYYIFDLTKKNSMINWLLEKQYNVFVISWRNPDEKLANIEFANYMNDGVIAAINQIENITKSPQVSAMGYCLGGTLLAMTLSYFAKIKDNRIKSASFLTTLLDFADAGDISLFINNEQIDKIENKMEKNGLFNGKDLSAIFSILRANDMIWSFFVNNYLLGNDPIPFDLLYWNSDVTNLPAKMHNFYLRNMYLENNLIQPDKIKFNDVGINLADINIPTYFLATKEDHIAPWKSVFKATKLLNKSMKFILSESGHVAGVINHPNKNKYGFWSNENNELDDKKWLDNATRVSGSWWDNWHDWQSQFSDNMIEAVMPQNNKSYEAAPGDYVKQQYNNDNIS
ncbi:MAG: class I poly(R)-hydroxyalkanoic acid synthase, partial [Pseudomonadota bacterium]